MIRATALAIILGALSAGSAAAQATIGGCAVLPADNILNTPGRYLAPSSVPASNPVTVRAASVSTPTSSGAAMVTIVPLPSIASVSPSTFPTGSFTLAVDGKGFTPGGVVTFGGVDLTPSVVGISVSPSSATVTFSRPRGPA